MRALNKLKQDGFIYADSTRGTFVSENPPHLTRYALAFQARPVGKSSTGWNRFWRSLHRVAGEINAGDQSKVETFFDINSHTDEPDHRRLLGEVINERLAGAIFVGPVEVMSEQCMQISGLPIVAITAVPKDASYPRVYIDYQSFVTKACDYLASRGRRRVAVLCGYDDGFAGFQEAILARGMDTKPFWQLPFETTRPNAAFAATRLLLDAAHAERPDALVVCDDNMVESALAAVSDAGIQVPRDLEIVAHCNWQELLPTTLPIRRLGYDSNRVLRAAMNAIDSQRRGETHAAWVGIKAEFEDEIITGQRARGVLL
jgi:DNA-binding LacI/PurR family transcriptional regulator